VRHGHELRRGQRKQEPDAQCRHAA
jgi:hypothetical protein